ncbi:hypothetical protein B0I35DRAFT_420120 [Stachybotrys elegans]|uniref:Uncharacterized protein n=1 Tax=Stachybotrys elegans TaxID=80388 RepID=A0A8K0T5X8_9HYPO|nr:hypothetical protein B0I35DRAFT_420120 [Stachybotrys elegans]
MPLIPFAPPSAQPILTRPLSSSCLSTTHPRPSPINPCASSARAPTDTHIHPSHHIRSNSLECGPMVVDLPPHPPNKRQLKHDSR